MGVTELRRLKMSGSEKFSFLRRELSWEELRLVSGGKGAGIGGDFGGDGGISEGGDDGGGEGGGGGEG